ncbi:signal peptidase II [Burkholderia cenocepacia]
MLIIGKKLSPYALLSISGLLAASDQAVKWLVQQSMAYGEYVSVTPFFNWVHLWNTGAAFSLFANGGGWQRYFFIGIAVVVSIFLIKLILENRHKGEAIAYSLILGGVLGIFRPKTTKCSGGPAVCGLQRGITFFEIPIWALFE